MKEYILYLSNGVLEWEELLQTTDLESDLLKYKICGISVDDYEEIMN